MNRPDSISIEISQKNLLNILMHAATREDLAKAKFELDEKITHTKTELNNKIDCTKAELNDKIDSTKIELNQRIDKNSDKIDTLGKTLIARMDTQFKWTIATFVSLLAIFAIMMPHLVK